ncbi:MAG: hypothetical protein K2O62_05670, partial [Clostridia bacterium]|nr:hypothetical protein [Clostridia bacterium]
DYELQINSNNKLKAGENKLKVKYTTSDNKTKYSAEFPISGVVELSYKTISNIELSEDTFTYPVTASEILSKITSVDVEMNDGGSDTLTADQIAALMELDSSSDLTVGTKYVTFKIKDTDAEADYEITINKGTFDVSGITFTGDTLTYDESAHSIAYAGTLPDGVNAEYEYSGTKQATPFEFTNAGTYNIILSFTHSNANYNVITKTLPATLKIDKATVTGITFASEVQPEITDVTYTLEATGYPLWVTVTYSVTDEEGNPLTGTSFSAAGTYKFTATFTHTDGNYEQIGPKTATLTISDKPPVAGADDIVVPPTITATYNGSSVDYKAQNVPDGVDVTYTIVKKDDAAFSGTDIINVGEYTVTVSFDTGAAYAPL